MKILVTTQKNQHGLHTLVIEFDSLAEANLAIEKINTQQQSKDNYWDQYFQHAIALY